MKHLLVASLITLLTTASCTEEQKDDRKPLSIGSSIPLADVKMKSVDGKAYSIKDVKDKDGTLVMFSCNTCPYVVKYQERTLQAIKEARGNGFGVIIINSNEDYRDGDDSYNAMQEYAKEQQYGDVPYVVDINSAVADAFGATRTPETFLFNSKGQLVYHGALDDNQDASAAKTKHLSTAISELRAGKEVSVKNTLSVGCSIKRKS
jgi:thiol-disulfide isomerase/thioredoxin